MPFSIIRNDITKLEVDAVVNAANSRLSEGGGVCGAIFSAAGREQLQRACNRIGFCTTGDAVITKGFDLKAKYIIHTVGPVYGENPAIEEDQLYSCYRSSLLLAEKKKLSSIAFPVISSGIYGYPRREALKIATRAIKDFLDCKELMVYLVVYDKESFEISSELFAAVESYIDEKSVKPDLRNRGFESARINLVSGSVSAETCNLLEKETIMMCPQQRTSKGKVEAGLIKRILSKKAETFSEMLFRLIDEKGMADVEVYKRANIDRKLFSKMRKKEYTPRKTTVLALAISLRLDIEETKELLARAGFAFSDCNKFDIIIEYFISNRKYDIFEINETLFAFDQALLGA